MSDAKYSASLASLHLQCLSTVLSPTKTIQLAGLLIFFASGASQALEIADSGVGIAFPLAVHYSRTRGAFGSAGFLLGRSVSSEDDLLGLNETVYGLLLDGTIGKNDFSYSVGYGGGTSVGFIGAAIRATTLVGRPSEEGYFLERNQRAYGVELSAGMIVGVRVGVFKTERTHVTKFITSIGVGF